MSSSQTPPSNETETPDDVAAKPATPSGEGAPFRRGQIVWGRPPQAVFRAGPLPRDEGLARLLAMPPHPEPPKPVVRGSTAVGTGAGIAGGSNIPQARPQNQQQAQPQAQTRTASPAASKPAGLSGGGLMSGSLVPGAGMPRPQPKPAEATPPKPVIPAEAGAAVVPPVGVDTTVSEIKVDSVLEPVVASSSRRAHPVADRADDVSPRATDAGPSRKKPSRLMMAATAALVIAAGAAAVWWNQKSHPDNPQPATEAAAPAEDALPAEVAAPIEAAPAVVQETTPAPQPAIVVPQEPAPVTAPKSAPQAVTTPAASAPPSASARAQPAPTRSPGEAQRVPAQNPVQMPSLAPAPAPVVVVTPPEETVQGPPPTVAKPQQRDPDAPVVTRPQKLD